MALALYDRVQQTGSANTTVSFTLSGSVTGFQSFSVVGNTNTTYYSAFDASGNWEVGLGTYSTTGPTLTRTTIYSSSNSNAAATFSGSVNVFVTYPSGKSVNLDASNNASALGTVASGTWQGTVITPTYGGTGVATLTGIAKGNGTSAFTAATSGTDYSAGTSALTTGILKSTTTTGALTIAVAADFPTLNQNTSGTAAGLSSTLVVGSGGTGATTFTANGILYGNTTSAVGVTAAGTTGQVLTATTGSAPTWASPAASGATITPTTTAGTYYVVGTTSISGTQTVASISNTNAVSYDASTGALSAVSMVSSSDERLKTNWASLDIDFVSRLADVKHGTFERISSGNREVGVTAQSLKEILPEAVIESEEGLLGVNYGGAALVAAIELAKEVKELRAEIKALKAE
jgi:hypothetical protein